MSHESDEQELSTQPYSTDNYPAWHREKKLGKVNLVSEAASTQGPYQPSNEHHTKHKHHEEEENENERLLLFSDGVIAFALTIIIVFIKVETGKPVDELPGILQNLFSNDLLSYFFSFLLIGLFWNAHHRIFRYISRASTGITLLNLMFLLLIVFVPIVNHLFFLIGSSAESNVDIVYIFLNLVIFVLVVVGLSLVMIWWYACRHPRLLKYDLTSREKTYHTLSLLGLPLALIMFIAILQFFDNITLEVFTGLFYIAWLVGLHFYRRGMEIVPHNKNTVERIILFTDCVIGIAITLSIAQIELPTLGSNPSQERLMELLSSAGLRLNAFIYGFLLLGAYWFIHYVMFHYIKRYNGWIIFFNFAFLLCCILLYVPISTFISYPHEVLSSQFYYISQLVILLTLGATWFYALRNKHLLDPDADVSKMRTFTVTLVICLAINGVFALLSCFTVVPKSDQLLLYGLFALVAFIVNRVQHIRASKHVAGAVMA